MLYLVSGMNIGKFVVKAFVVYTKQFGRILAASCTSNWVSTLLL